MSKLFEQFKKDAGDNWSYKNGWDFAPEEIVTQKYIEWLEQKLTSDNSDYAVTASPTPKLPNLKDIEKNMYYKFNEWEAEIETVEGIVTDVLNSLKKLGNFA